jgi:hypothetical protein
MKTLKFLQILFLFTLCSSSSCEEEKEDKLPGTKPEMLIGKWEGLQWGSINMTMWCFMERYEFTETGGFTVKRKYDSKEKIFLEPDTVDYFTDWSYSKDNEGDPIIFFRNGKGSRWGTSVYELSSDSIILGCHDCIYYKIKE